MGKFVIPRNYMQDKSILSELNFNPTEMYVGNNMHEEMKLMTVVGKYNDYFVAFPIDTYWSVKVEIKCELFLFAIDKGEAEKITFTETKDE